MQPQGRDGGREMCPRRCVVVVMVLMVVLMVVVVVLMVMGGELVWQWPVVDLPVDGGSMVRRLVQDSAADM